MVVSRSISFHCKLFLSPSNSLFKSLLFTHFIPCLFQVCHVQHVQYFHPATPTRTLLLLLLLLRLRVCRSVKLAGHTSALQATTSYRRCQGLKVDPSLHHAGTTTSTSNEADWQKQGPEFFVFPLSPSNKLLMGKNVGMILDRGRKECISWEMARPWHLGPD